MTAKLFYFLSTFILLAGAFIFITPALLTTDLIFPERIDSAYVAYHAGLEGGNSDSLPLTPDDVELKYSDIDAVSGGVVIRGWFVHAGDTPANTLVIIHDLNESRILYLDHLRQFHDRGLNVAVFDQRAHGSSGGTEFTPGLPAVADVRTITDSVIARGGTRNLVFYGTGIGAAVAIQAAVFDDRCKGLVLQSPFNDFESYLHRYARQEWRAMNFIWYPVFKRRVASMLQYPMNELELSHIASYLSIPTLFIIGTDDNKSLTSETLQVYDASAADKKELFLVKNTGGQNLAKAGGESFYNRVAAFIVNSMPKEQKTTRYKKLAFQ